MKAATLTVLFACVTCGFGIDGPDTITKYDAEERIALAVFLKAGACGFGGLESSSVSNLGNREYGRGNPKGAAKTIYYEVKAVDHCLRSLHAMPCPSQRTLTPTGRPYEPEYKADFLAILFVTRVLNCTFRTVRFLELDEPGEGKIL